MLKKCTVSALVKGEEWVFYHKERKHYNMDGGIITFK